MIVIKKIYCWFTSNGNNTSKQEFCK